MFCTKCGKQFEGNFCPFCGAKAASSAESVSNGQPGAASGGQKSAPPGQSSAEAPDPMTILSDTSGGVGLMEQLADKAVQKLSGKATIRVSPEQLAELTRVLLVYPSDAAGLKELTRVVKGSLFLVRKFSSPDGRYQLVVQAADRGWAFGIRRAVWIWDETTRTFYHLGKNSWYRQYRTLVNQIIAAKQVSLLR